ncbi:hypothetical protein ACJ73_07447 [Blastomyces percursus]|uniref:Uncharacterized protein n=1 Tax=Blastomyces percursus TaxID=1658174 RepID=A0A1J9PY00_9EURO|nr:hypothetical protein ACJ73_07447 [Blastomyces percursus]
MQIDLRLAYKKLHGDIIATVSAPVAEILESNTTLREKWIVLEDLCSKGAEEAITQASLALVTMEWEKDDTPVSFVTRYRDAYIHLKNLSPEKADDTTAIHFICKPIPGTR